MKLSKFILSTYRATIARPVRKLFFNDLVAHTQNFADVKWLGQPIWQNVLDLWTIQETIAEIKPALLIECGTNRGGSSLFYANLFDLMGHGEVITIDIEKLHTLTHPRITYLLGSSTSEEIVAICQERARTANGPVMVILDSDHSEAHVACELKRFSPLVTPGSYCLVQDGVIDDLLAFRAGRPGPLPAIRSFLKQSNAFELDEARSRRYLITHHTSGWLRRREA